MEAAEVLQMDSDAVEAVLTFWWPERPFSDRRMVWPQASIVCERAFVR